MNPEDLYEPEFVEWIQLTPAERFIESARLWQTYLTLGGSLDPEPDPQSPFFDEQEWREISADGGTGLRIIRRSGV